MVKEIVIGWNGMTAAFDESGHQVPDAQGELLLFYYLYLKAKGLADQATQFEWVGRGVTTGEKLETKWRLLEGLPT